MNVYKQFVISALATSLSEKEIQETSGNHGFDDWIIEYTLWLFNIAMKNGPCIDGLPGFTY